MGTPIYLVFTTSTHLVSRLIQFFTGSKISHVEFVYPSAELGGWVALGSQYNGWVLTPLETSDAILMYAFRMPNYNIWPGIHANRRWLGAKYDIGALLGMIKVTIWWRLFRQWVKNPTASKRAWFCSEMARNILTDAGVPLSFAMEESSTSPESLLEAVQKLTGIVSYENPTCDTLYRDAAENGFKVMGIQTLS